MDFKDLSPELREKVLACKKPDELIKLADEAGVALSDEQVEALSGGAIWDCDDNTCDSYDPDPW